MIYQNEFNLLFCAVAFESKAAFHNKVRESLRNLHLYYPFNSTTDIDFLCTYMSYIPDFNPVNLPSSDVSKIGVTMEQSSGKIKINIKNLSSKLESIKLNAMEIKYNHGSVIKKEINDSKRFLLVLLLPPQGNGGFENEFDGTGEEEFYFIATSCDGNWEQVIIRSACKLAGLSNEFELDGPAFEKPPNGYGEIIDNLSPNLMYSDTTFSSIPAADTKWAFLDNKIGFDFPIRRAPGHPQQADWSIPKHNFIPKNIELWEGGGGYRTHIYRSAHDCLMRRQIGNKNLPVRDSVVPLCPVCSAYMLQRILEFGRENRVPSLEFRGFMQQL